MADRLRADELRTGHRVKLTTPLPGREGEPYGQLTKVSRVDEGSYIDPKRKRLVGVYKLEFKNSTFALMCDGDREFEVESSVPLLG